MLVGITIILVICGDGLLQNFRYYYIHKIPFWGKAAQFLLPTANWPSWKWRWLDTFDWYTPKYQWKHTWPEVYKWFRDEGFTEIELFQEDRDSPLAQICMRGRKA